MDLRWGMWDLGCRVCGAVLRVEGLGPWGLKAYG